MTSTISRTSSNEHPFYKDFGNYDWGTATGVTHAFFGGPLNYKMARELADRVNAWTRSDCTQIFKGVVTPPSQKKECYYVYVPTKNHAAAAKGPITIPANDLSAPLPDHPFILLNHRVDTDVSTIQARFDKHFQAAQQDLDLGHNPEWNTIVGGRCESDPNAIVPPPMDTYKTYETSTFSTRGKSPYGDGPNPYNEDKAFFSSVKVTMNNSSINIPVFGVLDGHFGKNPALVKYCLRHGTLMPERDQLGKQYAAYVMERLPQRFQIKLQAALDTSTADRPMSSEAIALAINNSFKHSFAEISEDARNILKGEEAGTTATIACIINDAVYVACSGDSRAIISTPHTAIAMSKDAKPKPTTVWEQLTKIERSVYNRGSEIVVLRVQNGLLPPIARVKSMTAITKALGHPLTSGINPRPELIRYHLSDLPHADNYLVIASDGLWDKASSNQVSEAVQEFAQKHKPFNELASHLAHISYNAGSHDNITVIVIKLPYSMETRNAKRRKGESSLEAHSSAGKDDD